MSDGGVTPGESFGSGRRGELWVKCAMAKSAGNSSLALPLTAMVAVAIAQCRMLEGGERTSRHRQEVPVKQIPPFPFGKPGT